MFIMHTLYHDSLSACSVCQITQVAAGIYLTL
jgi:hypothetical protein